jgi:hypothetical protein
LAALIVTACASGRSATELRETLPGRMPPPPGSALAWETYTPSDWNITGPNCAHLERTYASNDAQAFHDAVATMIRGANDVEYPIVPGRPIFLDRRSGGYSPSMSASLDGVTVQVDFYDLDDPGARSAPWIDARAWRYVIDLRIWDVAGCSQ